MHLNGKTDYQPLDFGVPHSRTNPHCGFKQHKNGKINEALAKSDVLQVWSTLDIPCALKTHNHFG